MVGMIFSPRGYEYNSLGLALMFVGNLAPYAQEYFH
jgi:hypothetical protein